MAPNILRNMRAHRVTSRPVPLVRPPTVPVRSPAERPGRSAAKAFDTMSAEPSEPTRRLPRREWPARRVRSAWWQAALLSTDKVAIGGCSLRPVAPTEDLGFGTGARFRSPGGGDALYPIRMAGT